nr:GFA family protein [uncultured Psychrobacter sp.]
MNHYGSCLCGGIVYQISGDITDVLNCHCSMCRKLHSSAFRTRGVVLTKDWQTTQGQELLTFYESSSGEHKGFCRICGSQMYTKFDAKPEVLGFPLGTLDNDPQVTSQRHIFVASKAPWHSITDDLPQIDEY